MYATIIISVLLFIYAIFMIKRSFMNLKKSLRGEGCSGCSSDCSQCNVITDLKLK